MGYNIKKQSQTYLPIPNNVELNFTGKDGYIHRLMTEEVKDENVYGISSGELLNWIYHNFNSMFVLNKELSLEEYKKLIK
jgi:hypothetical protein